MNYELHPLCTLFPRLAEAEFAVLVEDIKENGLREPITLHEGMILDGGNRYRACIEAGVEPEFKEYSGDSIVAYVLSSNLHRRHLSPGQQAAIVASAQDWAKAQTVGNPQLRNVAQLDTAANRAATSGASHRTQQMADAVAKKSPELAKQVAHGEISLPKALKQISPQKSVHTVQPDYDEAAMQAEMMQDAIDEVRNDNERLRNMLASNIFNGDDDEKAALLNRLNDLTEENKQLKILNRGLTESRNRVMAENASMRKQLTINAKKLKAVA